MSGSADEPLTTAGEYVLGSLEWAEMQDVEARRSREPEFATAVKFWEDHLTPLCRLVAPVSPPPSLWARLALATGVREAPSRDNARVWQASTAAALLAAAGLAIVAFLPRQGTPTAADVHFAAALAPLNVSIPFLAEARPDGQLLITSIGAASATAGQSLELWELQLGATRPVSLGLLTSGQSVVISRGSPPWGQAKLLVSQEPAGGSPTGQPTGPVLFGGALTQVTPPGR